MNRHNIILVVITAFVLLPAIVSVSFRWFSSEPILVVYLRCDGDKKSGTLSITTIQKNGKSDSEKNFDLKTVCETGKAEFRGYLNEENLQFESKLSDGKIAKVIAKYGRDIQRDQNGFYMVLKIMDTPPFIANDRI